MKKALLVVLIAVLAFLVYRNFRPTTPEGPDLSKPQGAAEFFFGAAMADDEVKLRRVCTDDNEPTLLQSARSLRDAIPPDQRSSSFRWQNTVTEMGEDQAYTGKIGTIIFMIGLRKVGDEYQVCRALVGG